ncbi:MAG: hypothetical protein V1735_01805 [Nanoarchaeota archaeon]
MAFSKSFPKRSDKSVYPNWVDVRLSDEEERAIEAKARQENIRLFKECIVDAKVLMDGQGLKPYQTNIIEVANALFEKRASHAVFWKENASREKFEKP